MKTPFAAALVLTALLFSPAGRDRRRAARTPTSSCSRSTTCTGISRRTRRARSRSAAATPSNTHGVQTGWTQNTVPAGGIAYLATHIKALRATNPNTITVGAGDLIGASPLVSALFHDEPAIEALNSIGLDVSGVGNHEFDEGVDELLRMQLRQPARRRRLPSGRRLPGRHAVRRLALPVPRRERLLRGHRHDDPAAVRGAQGRQREARLHRAHVRGHADRRDAERRRGARVQAGGRDRQRARRAAARRAGRQGVRRAAAPGRRPAASGAAGVPVDRRRPATSTPT